MENLGWPEKESKKTRGTLKTLPSPFLEQAHSNVHVQWLHQSRAMARLTKAPRLTAPS